MLTINTYDHEYLLHKMSMALPLIKKTTNKQTPLPPRKNKQANKNVV